MSLWDAAQATRNVDGRTEARSLGGRRFEAKFTVPPSAHRDICEAAQVAYRAKLLVDCGAIGCIVPESISIAIDARTMDPKDDGDTTITFVGKAA